MTIDLPSASYVYPPKARLAIKWPCSRPQAGCQRCTQRFTAGSSSLTGDLSLRTGRISNHAQDALITTGPGTRYSRSLILPLIDKLGNALYIAKVQLKGNIYHINSRSSDIMKYCTKQVGIKLLPIDIQNAAAQSVRTKCS